MRAVLVIVGVGLLMPVPADAQAPAGEAAADRRAQDLIDNAKAVYGDPPPAARCARESADEIVVCLDRPKDQRVPSTAQTDPGSRAARRFLDGNIPTAPNLEGKHGYCPSCPKFGAVPPPVYYVDVTALPAPPEGSEADRIAKGEARAP